MLCAQTAVIVAVTKVFTPIYCLTGLFALLDGHAQHFQSIFYPMHQTKYTQGECSPHTALPWAHISTSRCRAVGKSVWDCHLIIKQSSPTNEPQTGMNSVWPFWWPFTSSCLATGRRSGKCRVNVHKWYTGTSGIKYLCPLRINQIYCILFLIMLNEWFQLFIWNIFKFFAW